VRLVAILTQLSRKSNYSDDLPFALTNVREVILRRDSSIKVPASFNECELGGVNVVGFFKKILPNLDILDIGALAVTTIDLGGPLNLSGNALSELRASVLRCTAEVVYRGCHFSLMQPNPSSANNNNMRNSLREIHIDPFGVYLDVNSPPITAFCKEHIHLEQEEWFHNASVANNGADWVLLQEYPNLERVALKHAVHLERYDCLQLYWKKLPQEALIKFARHTPKLRWFCSDLTQDNIAILKEERPEVEFCN
jgi:hypothetical protein